MGSHVREHADLALKWDFRREEQPSWPIMKYMGGQKSEQRWLWRRMQEIAREADAKAEARAGEEGA